MENRTVIITGMHRSGTSLVASLLQKAGLSIGDNLLGADKGNLRGHFEDIDFYRFHDDILRRHGESLLVQSNENLKDLTVEEIEKGKQLLKDREELPLWGWKDPRTALFLNFWYNLLPEVRCVFVYRHPTEVVSSLLRRGTDKEVLDDALVGLRSWQLYNQAILEFYQQHPDRCILVHISAVTADAELFVNSTTQKLDITLQLSEITTLYKSGELVQLSLSREVDQLLELILPGIMVLYSDLQFIADLPIQRPSSKRVDVTNVAPLQQLALTMTMHGILGLEQRSQLFSVLLTTVAPEAVSAGKLALEKIQHQQLERRLISVEKSKLWKLYLKLYQLRDLFHVSENAEVPWNQSSSIKPLNAIKFFIHIILSVIKRFSFFISKPFLRKPSWLDFSQTTSNIEQTSLPDTKKYSMLFISHSAQLAGAEIVFLNIVEWIQSYTCIDTKIIALSTGPLLANFKRVSQVLVLKPHKFVLYSSQQIYETIQDFCPRPILIYGNTLAVGQIYQYLEKFRVPIITHVHELENTITTHPDVNMNKIQKYTTHYIACSESVKNNLISSHGVPPKAIDTIYEFIKPNPLINEVLEINKIQIKQELQLKNDKILLFGCGLIYWRKGPDIFIDVAIQLCKKGYINFHFYWIGELYWDNDFLYKPTVTWEENLHKLVKYGIQDKVNFLGGKDNPRQYLMAGDIFILPSREDPFPLVALEAAECQLPIVCFDEAGGMPDFVGNEAGFTVPYLDIDCMTEKIAYLIDHPQERERLGRQARKKLLSTHTVDKTMPDIFSVCRKITNI